MRSLRIGFLLYWRGFRAVSEPEELRIDLSATLVAEPGMRMPLPQSGGWVWSSIWVKSSVSGARYAEFAIHNACAKPLVCTPAFGSGRYVRATGHRRMWCDPGRERTFDVALPANESIDRVCLYVETESVECVYVLSLEPRARNPIDFTVPALAVAGGVAAGILVSLLWQRAKETKQPEAAGAVSAPAPAEESPPPQEASAPTAPPAPEPPARDDGDDDDKAKPPEAGVPPRRYPVSDAFWTSKKKPEREITRSHGLRDLRYAEPIFEEPRGSVAFSGMDSSVIGTIELLEQTRRSANYVVKIVNDSSDPLMCAAMGVHGTNYTALQPSNFRVEARTASAITVAVPLRIWSPFRRMFVNMRSRTLSYSLEANVPASPFLPAIAAFVVLLLLSIASATVYVQMRPRITAYALPAQAIAGSSIRAAYAVFGLGTATYAVTEGAKEIAGGTLASGSGSFTFPAGNRPAVYRVGLAVHGPLGAQTETRTVRTIEPKQVNTTNTIELIRAFEVDNAVVHSRQPIVTRYASVGESGSVRLLDAAQISVAQAPYSLTGISTMPAPNVTHATPYRVELIARKGGTAQTASVGVTVLPGSAPTTAPVKPGTSSVLNANQLLRILPAYARGNSSIRVRLLQHPARLKLALQSAHGVPLQSKNVASGQNSVAFTLPPVGHS